MLNEKLISWFLPEKVRHNKAHPRYYELYTVVASILAGVIALLLLPLALAYFGVGKKLELYYIDAACHTLTLFGIRFLGHHRLFNFLSSAVGYCIIFSWLEDSGMIYSTNICILHLFLLAGVLVDRPWGWLIIFTNLLFLGFVYYKSTTGIIIAPDPMLGSPLYALLMHSIITVFLGSFFSYTMNNNEKSRKKIIALRDRKISLLDEAVRERTEQLNSMRQTIAADFHDQTGNMLAAISRQASMLEMKLHDQPDVLPLVETIITNSNDLYASSKDFLWSLNNDSDDPLTLFQYLTGYGQNFYNQFDIAFSAGVTGTQQPQQLTPLTALNMIYIFKEAMSNVVKHSGADEVIMSMDYGTDQVTYTLTDNGQWKDADPSVAHYGLGNMERRSRQSGFTYALENNAPGTQVTIGLPLSSYTTDNK